MQAVIKTDCFHRSEVVVYLRRGGGGGGGGEVCAGSGSLND